MTENHCRLDGSVLGVQVMPSVEEAAADVEVATATNVPSPWVTDLQERLDGIVLAVHVMPPSVEEAAASELFIDTVTNVSLP